MLRTNLLYGSPEGLTLFVNPPAERASNFLTMPGPSILREREQVSLKQCRAIIEANLLYCFPSRIDQIRQSFGKESK
jgi:hypothetical protein